MSRLVSDSNENLMRVNVSHFFTDLEHDIQEALFTYWNDNLTQGQLNLILAPIHEKHKEYYMLLMDHKLNEFRRSARIGALLTYNARQKQAFKSENTKFVANENNLFGTLESTEQKLAQNTFTASDFTMSRIDENINQILTDGYKSGAGINEVSRDLTERFDQLRTWESNRIARTEIHGAQNEGVMASYEMLGVEYTQWVAADDDRTRDSHLELDGEIIPLGGTYSNGLAFPGDTSGDIEEWINCRCSNAPFVMPHGMMAPEGMEQFREEDIVPIDESQSQSEPQTSEPVEVEGLDEYALSPEEQARYDELKANEDELGFLMRHELRELEEQVRFNELHNQYVKEGKLEVKDDFDSFELQKEYLHLQSTLKEKLDITELVDEYDIAGKEKPKPEPVIKPEPSSEPVEEEIPYWAETTELNGKTYTNFTEDTDVIMDKQIKLQSETKYTHRDLDVVNNWGYEGHLDISAICFNEPKLKTGLKTDAEIKQDIKDLEKAIDKSPRLQENTTLFRGGEVPEGLKPGDIITIEGFQSYSFDEDVARGFKEDNEDRFLIVSHAEEGSKGVHIDDRTFEGLSEDEWLTQKGQKHKVINVDYAKQTLETEFINDW